MTEARYYDPDTGEATTWALGVARGCGGPPEEPWPTVDAASELARLQRERDEARGRLQTEIYARAEMECRMNDAQFLMAMARADAKRLASIMESCAFYLGDWSHGDAEEQAEAARLLDRVTVALEIHRRGLE
jgi:hypothetical protein